MNKEFRRFLRAATPYRVEYGPFPSDRNDGALRESVIRNIGAGGLLFQAQEELPAGAQLMIRLHLPGWREEGDDVVEAAGDSVAVIAVIAEVLRCEFDAGTGHWAVGVHFLGRILS